MPIEIEWHIPWDSEWSGEKKLAAANRLVEYMTRGTFFEVASRMRVVEARAIQINPTADPFIQLKLER